jgi:hypothetical protein
LGERGQGDHAADRCHIGFVSPDQSGRDVCVADEFLRVAIREGGKCSGSRPPAKRIYRWVVGLICCIAIGTACERMRRVGSFGVPVNSNLNELTYGANDRAN